MSENDKPLTPDPEERTPSPQDGPAAEAGPGPQDEPAAEAGPGPQEGPATEAGAAPAPKRRRLPVARLGAASGIYAAVVIAALILVNALGARTNRRIDLTANHQYTLHAATLKMLHDLKRPVTIYGFLQSGSTLGTRLQTLLNEYRAAGGGRITTRIVDPAAQPAEARRYGVLQYNEVVVVSGNTHATATPTQMYSYGPTGRQQFNGEAAVTNAILRAANPQHLTVYFLQGDGEHGTQQNYSTVHQALVNEGYVVDNLNLIQQARVPANAAAVVIAGPTQDLAPAEAKALETYAASGGHLLVLLDPTTKPQPHLYGMLAKIGVRARNDLVVDPAAQHHFQSDLAALVPTIRSQAITNPLTQGHLAVLMPGSVSLSPVKGLGNRTATVLLETSASAYAKTDLKSTKIAYDPKTDIKGPFDLGIAVASKKKGDAFRAVVLGSASFALDSTIGIQGNRDLFLNSVGWLTGRTQGITIQPTGALHNQVLLTGGAMRGLFYSFVFILPALCLVGATVVWSWRRRL